MERFTLVGLLAVVIPSLAVAQRVEVAATAGLYRSVPTERAGDIGLECNQPPCPNYFREVLGAGTAFGGRLTVWLGSRLGIDATLQHGWAPRVFTMSDGPAGPPIETHRSTFAATFLAIQPHVRLRIHDAIQAGLAVGPALAILSPDSQRPGHERLALALSGTVRARVAPPLMVELRASNTHLVGKGLQYSRNHVMVAMGMAWAFK